MTKTTNGPREIRLPDVIGWGRARKCVEAASDGVGVLAKERPPARSEHVLRGVEHRAIPPPGAGPADAGVPVVGMLVVDLTEQVEGGRKGRIGRKHRAQPILGPSKVPVLEVLVDQREQPAPAIHTHGSITPRYYNTAMRGKRNA